MQNNVFSGLFVGQNFVTLKQVDSTNNYLKDLLSNSKPVPEGTVIMAENQYAGRGQQQNTWQAEAGKNLTFSILLTPHFLQPAGQFDLTRAISLGVINALAPLLGEKLRIKWPNDIYYGDLKLGGMLIENIIQGKKIKSSIVGIGLNINQETFTGDVPNAISVKQILHKDYELTAILSDICSHIEAMYLHLKAGNISFIRNAYLARLYAINEERDFQTDEGIIHGSITGVTPNGMLVIRNDIDGELQFSFKQIKFIKI